MFEVLGVENSSINSKTCQLDPFSFIPTSQSNIVDIAPQREEKTVTKRNEYMTVV